MPDLVSIDPDSGEPAVPHQRIGAYGLLTRSDQLLLTRISAKDYGAGMWTLPGGGLDHGEDPAEAVVREFYEETSIKVRPLRVRFVFSAHFFGRNRAGVLEDFHGLSIVYDVEPLPGSDLDHLEVIEEDSSTDLVEWVQPRLMYDVTADAFDRPLVAMADHTVRNVLATIGPATN